MPRDLADVLHYFMPELDGPDAEHSSRLGPPPTADRPERSPAALPILGVPIGDRDVLRAAFTWNLAIELARLGSRAIVVAPEGDLPSALWPEPGVGPLGAELVLTGATSLGPLYRAAADIAVGRALDAREGGLVLVRIPPAWIRSSESTSGLLRWLLLLTSSNRRDLLETYDLTKLVLSVAPSAEVGITIHGAKAIDEAAKAFDQVAGEAHRNLGLSLTSYGLLMDDLHVYRAIVAQRPIGLVHPQSPAARALGDVARMLRDDAPSHAVA